LNVYFFLDLVTIARPFPFRWNYSKNINTGNAKKKRTNNPIIVVAIIKTNTCRMGMMKLQRRTGKESKSSSMPNRYLAKECQQHRHNNQMECKRIPSSIHHLL
jgi:hypothetical protein